MVVFSIAQAGRTRTAAFIGLSLMALGMAGCHKKPEGQVVATVNGDEVTRRDLVSELQAAGGQSADDLKAVQPQLVESVINRKLLVQEAKRENLDKNPQYLSALQRTQEVLLAQMLAQTWTARAKAAKPAEVQAFIAQNPLMFGQRKLLLVNEIGVPGNGVTNAQLANLHSNDQIAAFLNARKQKFQRGVRTVDTLTLPGEFAQKLVAQLGKEPIAIRNGNAVAISQVLQMRDAPIPSDQQTKVAQMAIQRQRSLTEASSEVKQLRDGAEIQYLPGFAPPKAK